MADTIFKLSEISRGEIFDPTTGKVKDSLLPSPIDALDSTRADAALSAKQGKVLNDAKASKASSPTAGHVATLDGQGNPVDGGVSLADMQGNMTELTYAQLVALVNNAQLVKGRYYRITDFVTTCGEYSGSYYVRVRSAGHAFDIIVLALSESVLSEEARAIQHAGDTYFAGCDLAAWRLWYKLENDTQYDWAVSDGKGIIYRMIDEFDNDCPYDFKNIQFKRGWSATEGMWSNISYGDTGLWCYTFSSDADENTTEVTDVSLDKNSNTHHNIMREYTW